MGILIYNISEYSTSKISPFFANKEFKADVLLKIRKCKELVLYISVEVNKTYNYRKNYGLI